MRFGLWAFVALFATVCHCLEEDHLVSKIDLKMNRNLRKRDLSESDTEMILKALLSKLEKDKYSDEVHEPVKSHYSHESGAVDKSHIARMREKEDRYMSRSVPLEHEYKEHTTHEKHMHETKKNDELTEMDIMELLKNMKQMAVVDHGDEYKKDVYGISNEKHFTDKIHFKDGRMTGKIVAEPIGDKFSDKDVSLAESLHHMKIAGDVETYPEIKWASMQSKKMAEEKLHAEEAHKILGDESYMKKVEDIGKPLLKEETYPFLKEEQMKEHLKKGIENDKGGTYHKELDYEFGKFAEEKAMEAWKETHKDVFPVEEGKFKFDGKIISAEDITHGISDELLKKLKASMVEGKKLSGSLGKGEIEIIDELMKKLKISLEMDKEHGEIHKGFPGEGINMDEALLKKFLASLDKEKALGHDELLLLLSKEFKKEGIEINEEIIKKLQTALGIDKDLVLKHEELSYLLPKNLQKEGLELNEELLKKLKSLVGKDQEFVAEHDELIRLLKQHQKEEETIGGTTAYEKAKEQARKDAHVHLTEETMKKHVEESISHGLKGEQATKLFFEKGIAGEKAHGVGLKEAHGTELFMEKAHGVGAEKSLHGILGEEAVKGKELHIFGDTFDFKKAKDMHGKEEMFKDEKGFKLLDEDFLKKEKAYGKEFFDADKEIMKEAGDHHIHHILKDEEAHKFHESTGKHHIEGTAVSEKGHKTIHDLKTKFFELLTSVLRTKKCHLVSMRPTELLGIVNCVSKSKDPLLCEKFAVCEKKKPKRVIEAQEKCQKETIPGEMKKCTRQSPLFPSPAIPLKIFQCVAINVKELVPEERKGMIDFEECARMLKAESCGPFKWLRGPH